MIKIGISGACGKMGKRIAALALKNENLEVAVCLEDASLPDVGKDFGQVMGEGDLGVTVTSDLEKVTGDIDCLIDLLCLLLRWNMLKFAGRIRFPW